MDSYNVLRGKEPVRTGVAKSPNTKTKYCAGYIKYLPARGAIYGIEFSGSKTVDGVTTYTNPKGFKYYIFCSENAFIKYLSDSFTSLVDNTLPAAIKEIRNKVSKSDNNETIGNPAAFVVSSGIYAPGNTVLTGDGVVRDTIEYPANIGFQGVSYNHEPRPYSNVDGFINSNNVQYPLYLVVMFDDADPGIDKLEYQLITLS